MIWILRLVPVVLAALAVALGFLGSHPWIGALVLLVAGGVAVHALIELLTLSD